MSLRPICLARNLLTAGVCWLTLPAYLPAQEVYPRAKVGQFEVEGFDFRPEGAWRAQASRVRANRHRLVQLRAFSTLNSRSALTRVAGTYSVPVIPVAFQDRAAPFPATSYQDVLFGQGAPGRPYSVSSYYTELSRGMVSISGMVLDWVTADSTEAYYADGCNGIGVKTPCPHGGVPFGELLLEAVTANDTGALDWGQFDNDGPDGIPNSGDDDGFVDFVLFLQPGVDGACGGDGIWAHRYFLRGWLGGPYVTKSPRRDAGGNPIAGQFIVIDDYTMQSAVGGPTACDGSTIMPVGTVAHETGHAFDLPDLYDTNLRSSLVTQGIGEWGIMGSGNYSQPYSPSRFEAWSLAELGWVTVDTLSAPGMVRLSPVASVAHVLYIGVPNTDEYFLLENRQPIGTDTAQLNPACTFGTRSCAKAPGLVVWHIDQGQVNGHGFRFGNTVNVGPVHGVALVQADGLDQLGLPGGKNRGDGGDPFPGLTGNTEISAATLPASLDNQGASAGFTLDQISQDVNGDMLFRYTVTPAGVVNVTLQEVTDQILGRVNLGTAKLQYLDSVGNNNGSFDVGDFLAFVTASQAAPASPQARVPAVAKRRAQ
jgi:M6 family metalloprotease-like protein